MSKQQKKEKAKSRKEEYYKLNKDFVSSELSQVVIVKEASTIYNKSESYFRQRLEDGTFEDYIKDGLIRKSGSVWLMSRFALNHYFEIEEFGGDK